MDAQRYPLRYALFGRDGLCGEALKTDEDLPEFVGSRSKNNGDIRSCHDPAQQLQCHRESACHELQLTGSSSCVVDRSHYPMNEGGDKLVINAGSGSASRSKTRDTRGRKKQGPFLKVKAGSAVVTIYRTESKGRVRYTLSFYRDGRRQRKVFIDLDEAQKEAPFVAQVADAGCVSLPPDSRLLHRWRELRSDRLARAAAPP